MKWSPGGCTVSALWQGRLSGWHSTPSHDSSQPHRNADFIHYYMYPPWQFITRNTVFLIRSFDFFSFIWGAGKVVRASITRLKCRNFTLYCTFKLKRLKTESTFDSYSEFEFLKIMNSRCLHFGRFSFFWVSVLIFELSNPNVLYRTYFFPELCNWIKSDALTHIRLLVLVNHIAKVYYWLIILLKSIIG